MNESSITQYLMDTFDGVHTADAWGNTFFFYNPDRERPDEFYFATLQSNDDESDRASNLDRPSVFRLNIGVSKFTYRSLFGLFARPASRSGASDEVDIAYDFSALDQLLPHPVYGRQYWVCILNPSDATFASLRPLLAEAYELAVSKYAKRVARG